MEIPSLAHLKKELSFLSEKELIDLISDLAKFSRDNKAFLYFKLNETSQPYLFTELVKEDLELAFQTANTRSHHFAKKSAQAIRRKLNKALKLSKNKTDQIDLILFFCEKLNEFGYLRFRNSIVENLYQVQLGKAKKLISGLHEDLKWDYEVKMKEFE
jgi:hypothetical protein